MENAPGPHSQSPAGGKDLRHYLHLLRKRWRVPVIATIAAGALAFVYTARQPRIYEAGCSLVLDDRNPQILGTIQEVIDLGSPWEFMETQLRIIRSQQIAQRVLDRVGAEPQIDPAKGTGSTTSRQDQVQALLKRVKVSSIRQSKVATITVRDHDPERAARVANAFADAYVESNLEFKLQGARSASS